MLLVLPVTNTLTPLFVELVRLVLLLPSLNRKHAPPQFDVVVLVAVEAHVLTTTFATDNHALSQFLLLRLALFQVGLSGVLVLILFRNFQLRVTTILVLLTGVFRQEPSL